MQKACRIIFESYDKSTGEIIARDELLNLDIAKPKIIDEICLSYNTQLHLVKSFIVPHTYRLTRIKNSFAMLNLLEAHLNPCFYRPNNLS